MIKQIDELLKLEKVSDTSHKAIVEVIKSQNKRINELEQELSEPFITKPEFNKMTAGERVELYRKHPKLYRKLSGNK